MHSVICGCRLNRVLSHILILVYIIMYGRSLGPAGWPAREARPLAALTSHVHILEIARVVSFPHCLLCLCASRFLKELLLLATFAKSCRHFRKRRASVIGQQLISRKQVRRQIGSVDPNFWMIRLDNDTSRLDDAQREHQSCLLCLFRTCGAL